MKTIQRISVMACLIPELLGEEDCVKDALGGYLLKPSSLGMHMSTLHIVK